uniref:Superoxide dismutase 1 copper chaperone n=1 Tax=Bionectria ochroleuca TaxID=29856 RepID=A0A8H7N5J9_BIOOC
MRLRPWISKHRAADIPTACLRLRNGFEINSASSSCCFIFFLTGFIVYRYRSAPRLNNESFPSNIMTVNHSFQTQFAVPLSCDGCVKSVSDSVLKLGGISKVEGNLKDQLIYVEGSAAPSAIVEAIQATGRDAILRGSGTSDSAAVSILETYTDKKQTAHEGTNREVRG